MKTYRAIWLLIMAVLLQACATAVPQGSLTRDGGLRSAPKAPSVTVPPPVAEQPAPSESLERSVDISSGRKGTASEKPKSSPLPPLIGKLPSGLVSPATNAGPPQPTFPQTEKQRVSFLFEKVDVSEVTSQIFGDYLKLNYIIDPTLQGRISFFLDGEFSKEELLQMVSKAYAANNIAVVPHKGSVLIQPIQRSTSSNLPIATSFLLRGETAGVSPVIVIYRLRYMDVKQAMNTVKFFLTPGRPLTADNLTNSLLFVEDPDNARTIVEVLKSLDVNVLREVSMEIVPLQSMAPQDAVQSMEALVNKLEIFKESAVKGNLAFIPLQNFGGVLVLAQNPELLATAKYWINALDVHGEDSGEQIHVYFVQNSLAADIADILNQAYGLSGASTKTARPEQRIVQSTASPFGNRSSGFGSSSSSRPFGSSSTSQPFGTSTSQRSFGSSATGSSSTAGLGAASATGGGTARPTAARAAVGGMAGPGPSLTGEVMIIPDEVNNALVIRANSADYGKIKKTVEALDILPRAVLIEVMIAEISLTGEISYGIEWFFKNIGVKIGGKDGRMDAFHINPKTTSSSSSGSSSDSSSSNNNGSSDLAAAAAALLTPSATGGLSLFWGSVDGDIGALLNLLQTKTDVNVLSTPTLLATDNKEASITVGGREPIATGSAIGAETGGSTILSSIQYEETGIILNVTPHINAGGLVRLEVEQTIRNASADPVTVGSTTTPRFTERNVKTTLLAQNGSTVVIGGIIEQRQNKSNRGIPGLMDIPIIRPFFSSKGRTDNRTELIIAITPHVVDHKETDVTREFLERLRSLKKRIQQ